MNKTREKLVKKRYCVNGEENWKDVVNRISKLPLILPKESETKEALQSLDFIPAGRIIRGFGNNEINSLFNCSVYDFINTGQGIDSRESIMNMLKVVFELESRGVGVGINFSALRPSNEVIKKVSGETGGVVSWLKVVNTLLEQISQGGARKGAFMSIVDIWHPDIVKFVTAKKDLGQLNKMNISVNLTNDFVEAVKNDEDWELIFPDHHHPDYDKLWNADIHEWMIKKLPVKVYQKMKARKLLNIIAENAWETGEPGLIFIDRANDKNYATGQTLRASNPCLRGDQKILTNSGYKRIDECLEKKTIVWNGFEWSGVVPKETGKNQKMLKVSLSNGSEVVCTRYHDFILKNGKRVESKNLTVGDALVKVKYPVVEGSIEIDEKEAYTRGFFCGDGCSYKSGAKDILLYGEKKELKKFLVHTSWREDAKEKRIALANHYYKSYSKNFVPDSTWDVKSRLNYLAGLIDSDGSVNKLGGAVSISSIDYKFLKDIGELLNTLGVPVNLSLMKKGCHRLFPDGKGGKKNFYCKDSYRLTVSGFYVRNLVNLGLNLHRVKMNDVLPKRETSHYLRVVSVSDVGEEKKVYCFNEPKNHSMVVNGCRTGNCGEEILSNEFCCLGHINLVNHLDRFYDSEKGLEVYDFDYQKLRNTISIAQNYLTSVIFANKYYFKLFETNQKNYRKIGIGVLGYADALIMMNLAYGSEKAIEKTEELMKNMITFAIEASNKMAFERKELRCFYVDESKLLKRFDFLDPRLKESVLKFGVANSRLLTIAPTGSTAQLAGTSYGIEPNFLLKYERSDILGKRIVRSELYKRLRGKVDDSVWKDTSNVTIEEHILTQEAVQKYNDGSISKTINLPHYATVKDVIHIFTRAIESSVIGVTVYRDGSREGVMNKVEDESEYCPECDHKLVTDSNCNSCPSCGWSACEV